MYSVTVRDHMMVAHSLTGQVFGPAQRLHGATYVVDATVSGPEIDADGILLDIGFATEQLHDVLAGLTYRNLDDDAALAGGNTTTEVLARVVADRLAERLADRMAGRTPDNRATSLLVTLHESHVAWASYQRPL